MSSHTANNLNNEDVKKSNVIDFLDSTDEDEPEIFKDRTIKENKQTVSNEIPKNKYTAEEFFGEDSGEDWFDGNKGETSEDKKVEEENQPENGYVESLVKSLDEIETNLEQNKQTQTNNNLNITQTNNNNEVFVEEECNSNSTSKSNKIDVVAKKELSQFRTNVLNTPNIQSIMHMKEHRIESIDTADEQNSFENQTVISEQFLETKLELFKEKFRREIEEEFNLRIGRLEQDKLKQDIKKEYKKKVKKKILNLMNKQFSPEDKFKEILEMFLTPKEVGNLEKEGKMKFATVKQVVMPANVKKQEHSNSEENDMLKKQQLEKKYQEKKAKDLGNSRETDKEFIFPIDPVKLKETEEKVRQRKLEEQAKLKKVLPDKSLPANSPLNRTANTMPGRPIPVGHPQIGKKPSSPSDIYMKREINKDDKTIEKSKESESDDQKPDPSFNLFMKIKKEQQKEKSDENCQKNENQRISSESKSVLGSFIDLFRRKKVSPPSQQQAEQVPPQARRVLKRYPDKPTGPIKVDRRPYPPLNMNKPQQSQSTSISNTDSNESNV